MVAIAVDRYLCICHPWLSGVWVDEVVIIIIIIIITTIICHPWLSAELMNQPRAKLAI